MRLHTTKTLTITPPANNVSGGWRTRLAARLTGKRHSPVRPAIRQVVCSKTGDARSLQRCVVVRTWLPERQRKLGNHGHSNLGIIHTQRLLDDTRSKNVATVIDWSPKSTFSVLDYLRSNQPDKTCSSYRKAKLDMLPKHTKQRLANKEFQASPLQKNYGNDWGLSANRKVYLPLLGSAAAKTTASGADRFFLFGLDEAAMSQAWQKRLASPHSRYRLISTRNNCAGTVLETLKAGGCTQLLAPPKARLYHDPRSVHRYAVALSEKIQQLNERADALMQAAPPEAESIQELLALGWANGRLAQCHSSLDYSATAAKALELLDDGWMDQNGAGIALRCIRSAMQNHEAGMKAASDAVPMAMQEKTVAPA